MPVVQLSAQFCQSATCVEGRAKTDYYDTAISGFILEVRSNGGKTFHLRYRDERGRQRQFKLGSTKAISFEKARQAAQHALSRVTLGGSPADERAIKRKIPTLQEFVDETYIPHIKATRRNYASSLSFLRLHLLSKLGGKHLDQITQKDLLALQQGMLEKGYAKSSVNKVVIYTSIMYRLAQKMEVPGSKVNPAAAIPVKDPQNGRDRVLTAEESRRLQEAVSKSENRYLKYIVALALLTGARKRELLDCRWDYVDMERRFIRVPLSKSGKPRLIPLSTDALAVLEQVPRIPNCPYVFPNPSTRKPFTSIYFAWDNARKAAGLADVVQHDLRRTFGSNLINAGHSLFLVGSALGHSPSNQSVTAIYARLSQSKLLSAVEDAAKATGVDWVPPEAKAA